MYPTKQLNRCNRSTALLAALTLALTATASTSALADPVSKPSSETRSAAVSIADLDLSTPDGLSTARDRLRTAARRLCKRVANPDDLSRESNYTACVDEAFANAVAKLSERAVGVVARSGAD